MLGFLYFLGTLMLIILISAIVYFFTIGKGEDPTNKAWLISTEYQYTGGYKILKIEEKIVGTQRTKLILSPRDVNYIKLESENKSIPKLEPYFINNDQLELFGDVENTPVYITFPESQTEVPKGFKKSSLFDALKIISSDNKKDEFREKMYNERIKKTETESLNLAGGEIEKQQKIWFKEALDDAKNSQSIQQKDDKK